MAVRSLTAGDLARAQAARVREAHDDDLLVRFIAHHRLRALRDVADDLGLPLPDAVVPALPVVDLRQALQTLAGCGDPRLAARARGLLDALDDDLGTRGG